ncbi:MAG: gliding motility-associated-like protein [Flavobacterium sp.]|jgi:gliding motility-associated-like protein
MNKNYILLVLLLNYTFAFSQLGFCNGSSGAPIFFENFGSGTTYGPALPAGTTNYTYVNSGFPNDGQYTLFYRTNLLGNNWLYSLDHTPDNQPNGVDGKCLIVNASNTPGQFYKRTVTGLCSNTTFEFSAWVINIINSASGGCSGTGIPINVTFEIWNASDTILLQSGNTGNINGTPNPIWNQFGLVFTMGAGQTSVILKMRNNGIGGCGNDLAIDDIMFRACGEYSTIVNSGNPSNSVAICENETITNNQLQVSTNGTASNVYQWQQSSDNVNYTDIAGATFSIYSIPTITATSYYRVKVANDIANLGNSFCSTLSDIFTIFVNALPNPPVSNGNQTLCSNQATMLSVTANTNESVNWYDASTNGNLLQSNSLNYTPTATGTFYAEAYNLSTGCISNTRTSVTLLPLTTASYSGTTTICSTETTAIALTASNTNATFNWTASSSNVTGFSNGTGNTITQTLTYSGSTSGTVTYTVFSVVNGCQGMAETIIITVNPQTNITPTFTAIPTTYCLNATAPTLPTTSSNATPINGTWSPATINTSNTGTTTYTFIPQSNTCINYTTYSLNITVTNNITPNFDATLSLCSGTNAPALNTTSPNGIIGTWNPSTINNTVSANYTFTPNSNQCAVSQTISVTIIPSNTTASYSGTTTLCSTETTAIALTASNTNATFNWTASSSNVTGFSNGTGNTITQTLNYSGSTSGTVTYIFFPVVNGCQGMAETITITVNPQTNITPTFTAIPTTYCLNATAPTLPTTSSNATPINGTWSPATINTSNTGTTTYTFIPQSNTCINYTTYSLNITVTNNITPNFDATLSLCSGTNAPILNTTSPNGIIGSWNPSTINNIVSANYTFTPNSNQCAVSQTISVTILEPTLISIEYTTSGAFSEYQIVTVLAFNSGDYLYQLDNGDFQNNNIFSNVTSGNHTVTVIDQNGCSPPLSKNIFILNYPHFFTPNGDGINDYWTINGLNNLKKVKIFIFDRYGKLIKQILPNSSVWDGTFNGYSLPADDYWFSINFEENNIPRTFKAHFSLSR